MLSVSNAFLQTIKNKSPQDIRLDFTSGGVITGADIAITSGGLKYTEVLNSATDVEFGRAVMSELSAALINADGRFTGFNFAQEFTAKIGGEVPNDTFEVLSEEWAAITISDDGYGNIRYYEIFSGRIVYTAMTINGLDVAANYYLRNGENMGAVCMILCGKRLYALDSTYSIVAAFDIAAGTATPEVTPTPTEYPANITREDVAGWAANKTCVTVQPVKGTPEWQWVPLGVFKGERPEKVRGKRIEFTAHDRMSLFDRSAESFADGLTFPCTLGEIFTKLCSFCGVGYVSATFPNAGKVFEKNPLEGTDYTCREILGYIAEAAGSYARMSRDGAVELVWFANADYTVTRTDRFEMTESEFLTPPIDRLEVYNSYGDQLNTSGTGDIVYGISDNPFLYIENDTQLDGLQPYVDTIYNRITSLPAYPPSSFRAEFNPAVQCGDIISVVDDYGETIRFPVFVQTIIWTGFGRATYENTGGMIRQNAPFTQRELEQIKKKSVKTKDLWTHIDSYLNSQEGIASITTAVGGKFVTPDDLNGYATTQVTNSISQSVSEVQSAITLSADYSKNTIGTNVNALLQLVSDANSSSIKLKADKIDFDGFTTFLRASDLGENGTTTIDGGRIKTGQISAERIDTSTLRAQQVYYYDSTMKNYFSVMSSSISGQSTVTRVGPKDIRNGYMQALELYGTAIYMAYPGGTIGENGYSPLMFNMGNAAIIPGDSLVWDIGSSNNGFNDLYVYRIFIWDAHNETWTRLRAYNDALEFRDTHDDDYDVVIELQ